MSIIDDTVNSLVAARRLGQTASAAATPLPDADAAYAVQAGVGQALGWFAGVPAGTAPHHWKSGGPSRQATLTHAPLPPQGVWSSPADARKWPFHLRGIEAEVALRISQDVDAQRAASLDVAGAARLVDGMCVSIELVDSHWTEALDAPALSKLADLQSHGALVLGEWLPFAPRDWSVQRCIVNIGAQPTMEFVGTHSCNDPAFVLPAWLRHATRDGAVVRAGTVVTTGTWCGLPLAQAGDRVTAEFPGIGRAEVQL
ncbi:MAG: fumarylacetoacetate hydrolase family protein [Proteobacteria bacterium]|nr:fumarylacetoacetate hydrolase family protein [Pseudomonadota bacterium]